VEALYQCWDKGSQPYTTIPQVSKYWASAATTVDNFWEAPHDLYWICGKKAYSVLPSLWHGSCTLGAIQPSFFLLAEKPGDHLGVPV
ncbi:ENR1 protein, partial [Myiagra hebetior]|nr:ENR1 protein [Myiagra hebetior]